MTVIETPRLILRLAMLDDTELFYSLWTNPRVMTFVGFPHGLRINQTEVEKKIEEQDTSTVYGRLLVVISKSYGQAMGECKMMLPDEKGISRTDVKLLPQFWGNKYGVEVKQALVNYLFRNTDCLVVEGTPNIDNFASIKMQESVGAKRVNEGIFEFPESMADYTCPVPHYVYHVFREDWERNRSDDQSILKPENRNR